MRITNNMMVTNTIRNINASANRLNEAQERVSSEQKISLPSDDPVVATRSIKYRNYVSTIEQYQKNVDDVTSWQEVTDDAMSNLSDVVTQIRTLTVKASSSTMTESDLAKIKTEISELQQESVEIMNTSYGGRYVFAGFNTSEAPYELADKSILASVTATSGTYDATNITLSDGLAAGTYSVSVAYDGTNYNLTMSDGTNTYTQSTTSATGDVTFTTTDGEIVTITAPTAGFADGDALSFTAATESVVTYKGSCLSAVMPADYSDDAITALYSGNTYQTGNAQSIKYNIGYDAEVTVNTEGQDVVGGSGANLFTTIGKLLLALDGDTSYKTYDASTGTVTTTAIDDIDDLLTDLDTDIDRLTTAQADLGARMNYVNRVSDRLESDYTTYTTLLSNNEDVDVSKATIEESSAQTVYEASLAVGAKAISKTLVDFIA